MVEQERVDPLLPGGALVDERLSQDDVVSALRDPGTALRPGTQLQRIQIVKGWIEIVAYL